MCVCVSIYSLFTSLRGFKVPHRASIKASFVQGADAEDHSSVIIYIYIYVNILLSFRRAAAVGVHVVSYVCYLGVVRSRNE